MNDHYVLSDISDIPVSDTVDLDILPQQVGNSQDIELETEDTLSSREVEMPRESENTINTSLPPI